MLVTQLKNGTTSVRVLSEATSSPWLSKPASAASSLFLSAGDKCWYFDRLGFFFVLPVAGVPGRTRRRVRDPPPLRSWSLAALWTREEKNLQVCLLNLLLTCSCIWKAAFCTKHWCSHLNPCTADICAFVTWINLWIICILYIFQNC